MNSGHQERPERIRKALDSLSPGVPHKAMAFNEVLCVPHRDHRVVEQEEVSFSVYFVASLPDEESCIQEIEDQEEREWMAQHLEDPGFHQSAIGK